jgi:ribosomal-protein-alanine N-acetyltransferase
VLPTIATRRLLLTPFADTDINALHEFWCEPEVREYLWDNVEITRARAAEVVHSSIASITRNGVGNWTIRTRSDHSLIGFCGFTLMKNEIDIELMYALRRQFWGLGMATESSQAALDWLWSSTTFNRIYAQADRHTKPPFLCGHVSSGNAP